MAKKKSTTKKKRTTKRKSPYTPSKSLKTFEKTIQRTRNFEMIYTATVGQNVITHPGDLIRASVVFSVAAMDAYFTDRFCESLVKYIKTRGTNSHLDELLEKAGLDTPRMIELLSMRRPFRRLRTLTSIYLNSRITQRVDRIDDLFKCYGLSDYCSNVQRTMGKTKVLTKVRTLVERRHQIAHDGDMNDHGNVRPITKATFTQLTNLTQFVEASDRFLHGSLPR